MKEDNATYTLHLYQRGKLLQILDGLSFQDAFIIYHKYDPFKQIGVDVYRNGVRLKYGEAMKKFSDPTCFVTLY